MITFTHSGNFKHTEGFFKRMRNPDFRKLLHKAGEKGVNALHKTTPRDRGLTANSWRYEIDVKKNSLRLSWYNTNMADGFNIAMLIQYGHGTRTGGFVYGRDYINPAVQPIFDEITEEIWAEVIK